MIEHSATRQSILLECPLLALPLLRSSIAQCRLDVLPGGVKQGTSSARTSALMRGVSARASPRADIASVPLAHTTDPLSVLDVLSTPSRSPQHFRRVRVIVPLRLPFPTSLIDQPSETVFCGAHPIRVTIAAG